MDDNGVRGLAYLLILALTLPPYWIALRKAGFNPGFALFLIVPGLGVLIATAILAFVRWPAHERAMA